MDIKQNEKCVTFKFSLKERITLLIKGEIIYPSNIFKSYVGMLVGMLAERNYKEEIKEQENEKI